MKQGKCERCEGTGEIHGPACLVRLMLFGPSKMQRPVSEKVRLETAVQILQEFLKAHKRTHIKESNEK